MIGFTFGIKDAIDILLVALIFYEMFRLLRRSGAANLFWGILAFVVAWYLLSYVFQLELTGALFDRIISVGAIALIVIFQEEIRGFFYRVGARFSNWHPLSHRTQQSEQNVDQIVMACEHMSRTKTGALIVLAGDNEMKEYTDTGEFIDAAISTQMIENIFFKNTPLHDGALFIIGNRLHSAACILPVSKQTDIPKHFGLRHRAALGLVEKNSDVIAIVVSEETGKIAIAHDAEIHTVNRDELIHVLSDAFAVNDNTSFWNWKNIKTK